jgi:Zn-dependent M16 (insulinase) family peptidase
MLSRRQLSEKLNSLAAATGLERELVSYWQKNLFSFSEETLPAGLRQLTLEVQQDLKIGPERTIDDLQELQKLIFTRDRLHLTVTADNASLDNMKPDILRFLDFLPSHHANGTVADQGRRLVVSRVHLGHHFPWYLGLVTPGSTTGTVAFNARIPNYAQVDRSSLIESLASNLFAGEGPNSFYMKATEAGLAYNSSIGIDRKSNLLWYYADRSPDVPALLKLVNATAAKTSELHDQFLVDYALRQTLSTPRSMYSISDRGRAIAEDIRDGNTPEKIRRFSKALLALRNNPDLAAKLKRAAPAAMGTVLPGEENLGFQSKGRSIFIFAASEEILKDVERRLPSGKLQRAWPSDFWIQ